MNSELSQRGAGGKGDPHLGLVSFSSSILFPTHLPRSLSRSLVLPCARHKRSGWLPDLQQEIWILNTQEEPSDGSSFCWGPVLGGVFMSLDTHSHKIPQNWYHIKPGNHRNRNLSCHVSPGDVKRWRNVVKIKVSPNLNFSGTINFTSHNARFH